MAKLSDTQALDFIVAILNADEDWNADTLDSIIEVIEGTGRKLDEGDE